MKTPNEQFFEAAENALTLFKLATDGRFDDVDKRGEPLKDHPHFIRLVLIRWLLHNMDTNANPEIVKNLVEGLGFTTERKQP